MRIYNTLTRQVEEFVPINPPYVGMYTCGPTVYDYTHLGHIRTYINTDILRRVLEYNGYQVKHVMNITDVGHLTSDEDTGEDKIEVAAKKQKKSPYEIARFFEEHFFNTMSKLNVKKPHIICRATEHINEQIELIKKLEEKGFTYRTKVGIIFDTSKFEKYYEFARIDPNKQKYGARVEIDPERKHPCDFALWITNQPSHIMQWDSPWGKGFPGWHIECSAMSMKYLGETFDIHTGGIDHIPIHHTNEIAQSESATGKKFVNYWVHNEFLLVEGQKMSKSLGNIYTIEDIEKRGFIPLALRYLFLTATYRQQMNFTWDSLKSAQNAFINLRERISELKKEDNVFVIEKYKKEFIESINDDLNIPKALSILWEVIKSNHSPSEKLITIEEFDKIFGLNLCVIEKFEIPKDILSLVEEREKLRKEKKWDEADKIREKIQELGYKILDTKEGPKLKKIY
jgi:cysteinyl-tRNA synthetase